MSALMRVYRPAGFLVCLLALLLLAPWDTAQARLAKVTRSGPRALSTAYLPPSAPQKSPADLNSQIAHWRGEEPIYALFDEAPSAFETLVAQSGDVMDGEMEDDFGGDGFGDFEDEFATEEPQEETWLDGYNRTMTGFNDWAFMNVLNPVARGWDWIAPDGVQRSINRFFKNLWYPIRFVNNLLQAEIIDAGEETARFVINSTIGILGLFDPAYDWFGLEAHDEDFGQTLAVWGVGAGPHIVLPILGPSNLRDTLALAPDYFIDPLSCVDLVTCQENRKYGLAIWAFEEVNWVSLNLGAYESLKRDAFDLYPFLRDSYEQNRLKEIEE